MTDYDQFRSGLPGLVAVARARHQAETAAGQSNVRGREAAREAVAAARQAKDLRAFLDRPAEAYLAYGKAWPDDDYQADLAALRRLHYALAAAVPVAYRSRNERWALRGLVHGALSLARRHGLPRPALYLHDLVLADISAAAAEAGIFVSADRIRKLAAEVLETWPDWGDKCPNSEGT